MVKWCPWKWEKTHVVDDYLNHKDGLTSKLLAPIYWIVHCFDLTSKKVFDTINSHSTRDPTSSALGRFRWIKENNLWLTLDNQERGRQDKTLTIFCLSAVHLRNQRWIFYRLAAIPTKLRIYSKVQIGKRLLHYRSQWRSIRFQLWGLGFTNWNLAQNFNN